MESFNEVVNLVKAEFKNQNISDTAYNLWVNVVEPVQMVDDQAVLMVKTPWQRDILTSKYKSRYEEIFEMILGFPVTVQFVSEEEIATYLDPENTVAPEPIEEPVVPAPKAPETIDDTAGNYEFTFETFIVGPSNNFAYAACKAISTDSTSSSYNPLFIYGPSGLGKTHLLTAISNEIKKQHPDRTIISVSSETFTTDLITAIAHNSRDSFQSKYRKADVLLIDDIQFISGKESTQEEFFHTFNELYSAGKQIVLTSDRPPKEIKTLEERLRSRFEWGLLTDIAPPNFETRIAIIKRKADLLNIEIPTDVAEFIATRLKKNIRQLEGAVKKLKAYKLLAGSPPSITVAQTVIREILNDNQPVTVTVDRILEEVAKTYSVTVEDLRSKNRKQPLSYARQVAIYIIKEVTQMSLDLIGAEFGGRDHSTVSYALRQVEEQIETNAHQKGIIEDIIKNIKNK